METMVLRKDSWSSAEDKILISTMMEKNANLPKMEFYKKASEKLREHGFIRSASGCIQRWYWIKDRKKSIYKIIDQGKRKMRVSFDSDVANALEIYSKRFSERSFSSVVNEIIREYLFAEEMNVEETG